MLGAEIAYSAGIVAGIYFVRPACWLIAAAAAFLPASIYFLTTRKWLAVTLALATFFTGGSLEIQLRGSSNIRPLRHARARGQQLKLCALGFDTSHV